jgi:hypothetical protein
VTVRKLSVAIDEDIAAAAVEAAERANLSLSAWLSRAAERSLTVERGIEAVQAWEHDHGALTEEELAAADRILDQLLSDSVRDAS